MNRAKAKFLQEKLAQEARAALEMGGSNAPTEGYARAITLIGKVWGLNDSDANEQFDLIQQDREYVQRVEVGDSEPSSAPNKDLALNWTGMECIEVLEGLFETSIHLNTLNERMEMFNLALLWRPSFRCSTIWPTFSRSKTNHRPPVASGSRWIGSSYEKSRRRRSLRATRRMTMSRKCSYKGGNLLKQKVQFKQQILLAQPKDIQGLKRQKPIPCRPVLFHRKLKGRNQ